MLLYILFILGFFILLGGAHLLVGGATSIAKRLNVSDLVIGLTIVAFGTSTPELFVNIVASIKGNAAIAISNILGSNVVNILLILGVSSLIFPLTLKKSTVWKEIPLSLLAAILVAVLANDRIIDKMGYARLSRIDGLVLISFFIIFLYYLAGILMNKEKKKEEMQEKRAGLAKASLLVVIGIGFLSLGANWIVGGAKQLSLTLGVSQSFFGFTIVALGTSLPEFATSAVAASKKNAEIAIGNIVGSNIFNIFFILGVSSIINPLSFQAKYNGDIIILILASFLLFISTFTGKKHSLDRWEGVLFIILYFGYIAFLTIQQ